MCQHHNHVACGGTETTRDIAKKGLKRLYVMFLLGIGLMNLMWAYNFGCHFMAKTTPHAWLTPGYVALCCVVHLSVGVLCLWDAASRFKKSL